MTDAARQSDNDGLSEARLAKMIAGGLPVATIAAAAIAGVLNGFAVAILVLAAGVLVGVIGLFWASIRVLSGDAPLPADLEALDVHRHGVDGLAARKTMLLRALKDLDSERALGKLEADDYEQVSSTYRAELKTVLRRIDEKLAPYREQAELLLVARRPSTDARERDTDGDEPESDAPPTTAQEGRESDRRACPTCSASNEIDAKFCKGCGAVMTAEDANA